MIKKIFCFLFFLFFVAFADEFKVKVGVSLAPYAYFVQKIGGEFVEATILIPENRNPKFYNLNYKQMKIIKDLKVLITTGVPYEKKWISRFKNTNPSLKILNLKECENSICYTWLNIEKSKEIAKKIAHHLRMIDIKNAQNYKKNLDLLLREMDELKNEIEKIFAMPMSNQTLISNQALWKNFTQEFDLKFFLLKDLKGHFPKDQLCFITPFDSKKQITQEFFIPKKSMVEVNLFKKNWKSMMLELANLVAFKGDKKSDGK